MSEHPTIVQKNRPFFKQALPRAGATLRGYHNAELSEVAQGERREGVQLLKGRLRHATFGLGWARQASHPHASVSHTSARIARLRVSPCCLRRGRGLHGSPVPCLFSDEGNTAGGRSNREKCLTRRPLRAY